MLGKRILDEMGDDRPTEAMLRSYGVSYRALCQPEIQASVKEMTDLTQIDTDNEPCYDCSNTDHQKNDCTAILLFKKMMTPKQIEAVERYTETGITLSKYKEKNGKTNRKFDVLMDINDMYYCK